MIEESNQSELYEGVSSQRKVEVRSTGSSFKKLHSEVRKI